MTLSCMSTASGDTSDLKMSATGSLPMHRDGSGNCWWTSSPDSEGLTKGRGQPSAGASSDTVWPSVEPTRRTGSRAGETTQRVWAVDILGTPSALLLALLAQAGQEVRYASGRVVAAMSTRQGRLRHH